MSKKVTVSINESLLTQEKRQYRRFLNNGDLVEVPLALPGEPPSHIPPAKILLTKQQIIDDNINIKEYCDRLNNEAHS